MKKNIMRVISLVLVAAMLFAFASCTQEVLIRFVDAEGNDINIGALTGGSAAPVADDTTAAPVVDDTTAAPVVDGTTAAPAAEGTTAAPAAEGSTAAPAAETPTSAPVSAAPTGTQAIADFYKTAVNNVKNSGAAGYTKKEWQVLTEINVLALADSAIKGLAANYMTTEDEAEAQVSAKGSKEAKDRFPNFTLTDYSKIASATCTTLANGNYKVKIVMKDEDTPMSTGSTTGQITNSVLYWDSNIEPELKKISLVQGYSDIHVIYQHFTIEAELTKDGKFVSLNHTGDIDIKIGQLKVIVNMTDKSGHLVNYCKYTGFKY